MKSLLILLSFFLFSCDLHHHQSETPPDHRSDFKKMQWLVGSWKGMYEGAPFYEGWRKINDTLLMNYAIEIKDGDTTVSAGSPVNVHDGKIHLGLKDSTTWEMSSLKDDEIIFKNDTLKYSNVITWSHSKDDHWLTTLKHPKSTVNFDMIKVPELDRWVDSFQQKQ